MNSIAFILKANNEDNNEHTHKESKSQRTLHKQNHIKHRESSLTSIQGKSKVELLFQPDLILP